MGEFRTRLVMSRIGNLGTFRHFERLDQTYLNDLVVKARQGSSNAFAELYAAVADRQMLYLVRILGDRDEALEALKDVFTAALRGIGGLTRPDMFLLWLSRLSANACIERLNIEKSSNGRFTLSQILNLPLAESQIMMMSCEQGLSNAEIADILNIRTGTVRRFLKLAQRHLTKSHADGFAGDENGKETRADSAGKSSVASSRASSRAALPGQRKAARHTDAPDSGSLSLSPREISNMLDEIFDACGRDPNNLPVEALSSYAVYRKERFSLQRGILAGALIVFMMLPLLFLIPVLTVDEQEAGERGLPVVTISVRSLLPTRSVIADIRKHNLPVYEAGRREYTIEPIRNGSVNIQVELINHQKASCEIEVNSVDSEGPELTGNETTGDTFRIDVRDAGIGVDYREIYAVGESGKIYYPLKASEEEGVVFSYPDEKWDVYIPDHIGNTLHLSVILK